MNVIENDSIYNEETFALKPLSSLKTWERNYRKGDVDAIANSIARFGFNGALRVWRDSTVMAGNHALLALRQLKESGSPAPVHIAEAGGEWYVKTIDLSHLNRYEAEAFAIADNHTQEIGSNEDAQLSAMLKELSEHDETLFKATGYDNDALNALLESVGQSEPPAQEDEGKAAELVDRAAELQDKWNVQPGNLYAIGSHRLLCGDSTKPEDVSRLMNGQKAALCHADPPYGMGKENDGVANDNLYGGKLDAFQMAWWKVARLHLEDNASAYIWGNDEDLWRLWYVGGLKDSERLTFRNEIIWDKQSGQGMQSEDHRMYPTGSERCLFFMLGEQGFNNNADNYWEGFEPIRSYLDGERKKLEWSNKHIAAWFGFHPRMADHWFSQSQWSFPLREQYERLQHEARGKGFKREFDELKREFDELKQAFYSTRAYFDNTHENMTDVWNYPRVIGDERYDHPTPKPVPMIERIMKSSAPEGSVAYSPFVGSGTDIVSAERTGRVAFAMELEPVWCAVTLERMSQMGLEPKLLN